MSASTQSAVRSATGVVLVGLIKGYQRTLSPILPVFLGPNCGCRFAPTCSHYAEEAVREHGAVAGTWLAAKRLLKCTPFHPGGYDPVPEAGMPRLLTSRG